MESAKVIRVVIADDHRVFRESIAHLLDEYPDISIVGQAASASEARVLVGEVCPDVAILDVEMGDMNGVEAARLIAAECERTHIIMLSGHRSAAYVEESLAAGALGYVVKDCSLEEIVVAIRSVFEGQRFLSPSASSAVCRPRHAGAGEVSPSIVMTDREREVLVLSAEGHSVKAIASMLGLSAKTVDAHRRRIIDKLGVGSVAGLVKYAIRHRFISLD